MIYEELPLKEKIAVELRYLGNTAQEISDKIEIPKSTIDGWFDKGGKLIDCYNDYLSMMNKKRQEEIEKKYVESDENILRITTFIMRKVGERLNGGEILPEITDFREAWKIQRTTQGLPTDVKKQDMTFNQKDFDEEADILKKIAQENDEPTKDTGINETVQE